MSCDVEWDLDGDCDVDKEDKQLLKVQQKTEKTDLKVQHKLEKEALKVAMGFPGECGMWWDLNYDCDVDKDDYKLLKLGQKQEKTAMKVRHTAEKAAMKAALQ
jgi:ubiquinone biosynthesis protein UbiJ